MKNRKIKTSFLFTLGIMLLIYACKKEQPQVNNEAKDPCDCASEVSADFVIEEGVGSVLGGWIETDTTFHTKDVRFRAIEENAEYTWYIGVEQFETQMSSRFFSEDWAGYDIPITLVVKKEPNLTCFPNDNGYDSITKTFHVSKYVITNGPFQNIEMGSIEGTYRVKSEHLTDSFDITINVRQGWDLGWNIELYNYNGKGDTCMNDFKTVDKKSTYRKIWFGGGGVQDICTGLEGTIHHKMGGSATIKLESRVYENGEYVEYNWLYEGRKLN